jgi:hypothetical protein
MEVAAPRHRPAVSSRRSASAVAGLPAQPRLPSVKLFLDLLFPALVVKPKTGSNIQYPGIFQRPGPAGQQGPPTFLAFSRIQYYPIHSIAYPGTVLITVYSRTSFTQTPVIVASL